MIGQHNARIGVGCWLGSFRQHRLFPDFPVVLEAIEDFLVPILEIAALAWILDDVE